MFGNWKRLAGAVMLSVALAACQVVPRGQGPVVAPTPVPTTAPGALPEDQGRHRVALLVPLSGPNGAVGQSIANAATMALLDTNASNLRITTYDTATGAGSAAARAIGDGNKLILGPLLGDDVQPVLAKARPAHVPLISFSNDRSVASRDAVIMGVLPEESIDRTVTYALAHGSKRFAAIVPIPPPTNTSTHGTPAACSALTAIARMRHGAACVASRSGSPSRCVQPGAAIHPNGSACSVSPSRRLSSWRSTNAASSSPRSKSASTSRELETRSSTSSPGSARCTWPSSSGRSGPTM